MKRIDSTVLDAIYPICRSHLDRQVWRRIKEAYSAFDTAEAFPGILARQTEDLSLPGFVPELARLEWALHSIKSAPIKSSATVDRLSVNPDLFLLQLSWRNLSQIVQAGGAAIHTTPEPYDEYVLVWRHPDTGELVVRPASDEDLLALKLVAEGIPSRKAAAPGQVSVFAVDAALDRAVGRGLLLAPPSRIRRDPDDFPGSGAIEEAYFSASVFTLQWHITQACDLHCRHCYDRSNRQEIELPQALAILDDLYAFCRDRQVRGQVSFTGGNPLLYPHFPEVYRAASERGFSPAILGNPAPRGRLEELIAIERPVYFQVSLEGLPEHNDFMRGRGHFQSVLAFLGILRDLEIYSMVMLTLTQDNLVQVLPLAEMLRDRTDLFTFNRLSLVGEGAKLELPSKQDYIAFLESYVDAGKANPAISMKDNLINAVLQRRGSQLFGGCTGYGCGAAFNFVALLPDGSVHACRKFPSPIGNVLHTPLGELYDAEAARKYRGGCFACRSCSIKAVCGGCLAVAYSHGLDIFAERDPYCIMTV